MGGCVALRGSVRGAETTVGSQVNQAEGMRRHRGELQWESGSLAPMGKDAQLHPVRSWCFVKMVGPELLLHSNIRFWVVLSIVIITFFVGMIHHYVPILLESDKKLTQEQISDRSAPSGPCDLTPP